jgi:hypothetical protein
MNFYSMPWLGNSASEGAIPSRVSTPQPPLRVTPAVLSIPDIITIVVDFLFVVDDSLSTPIILNTSKSDLYRTALVNRSFSRAALRVLWRYIDSFDVFEEFIRMHDRGERVQVMVVHCQSVS